MKLKKLFIIVSILVFSSILTILLGPRYNIYILHKERNNKELMSYIDKAVGYMENGVYAEGKEWENTKKVIKKNLNMLKISIRHTR